MEAAENYYVKAGLKNTSEYVKATLLLFDVYMYLTRAETETEPKQKARYLKMAEKLLEASAGAYMKSKHIEKTEEVKKLLQSVKEKQHIAMSLIEVIDAPAIITATSSFSTPTPSHETAVGMERFEHANIQTNLLVPENSRIGEIVELRLDLVNVAKKPGLIVRVEDIFPSSFEITTPPSQYIIEDGSINMKGKSIESLKIETIKANLRPTKPGTISISPQVTYVDDLGRFRTSKPEPHVITVQSEETFEFRTKAAQNAFNFLVRSFIEDYMKRRISQERSGWRTLMDVVKLGKVSKSSVYGTRGHQGRAIIELENRGLAETRIFLGERGRGGKILKIRISYEKDTIKRHIDQQIMKK
jgi:hypothetical protein